MNSENGGLLTATERERVDKRLKLLHEGPVSDGDELLLASALHRSHHSRDVLVMSSLGMSALALAVAVVVGGLSTNGYVALLLISYLALATVLTFVTLIAIRQAITAEAARVIVTRRIEQREHRARAAVEGRAAEASRTNRKRCLLRDLLGLP